MRISNCKHLTNQSGWFHCEINSVIVPVEKQLPRLSAEINSKPPPRHSRAMLYSRRSWNRDVEEVKTSSRWRAYTLMSLWRCSRKGTRAIRHISLQRDYVRTAVPCHARARARTHESISGVFYPQSNCLSDTLLTLLKRLKYRKYRKSIEKSFSDLFYTCFSIILICNSCNSFIRI